MGNKKGGSQSFRHEERKVVTEVADRRVVIKKNGDVERMDLVCNRIGRLNEME